MKNLKTILKEARESSGLSQKALSLKLGYETAQFVSNWERGVSLPPAKKIRLMKKILKKKDYELVSNAVFIEHVSRIYREMFGRKKRN